MPRKNSLFSPTAIPGIAAKSMAASFTSGVISVQFLDNIMLQIVSTGTPAGTFAVQVSSDYDVNSNPNTSNWVALPLSGTPTLSGSGDIIDIAMNQVPSPYMRLVYTRSSGTGTCNAWVSAKEV